MDLPEQHKQGTEDRRETDLLSGTTYQELTLTKTLEFYEKKKKITKRNQQQGSSPTFSDNWSVQKIWLLICKVVV